MGCSDSKQAALSEMNSMIKQTKEENSKLQAECDQLKGKPETSKKDVFQVTFEMLLKTLDRLSTEIPLENPKIDPKDINAPLPYEVGLNEKIQTIKDLLSTKETLLNNKTQLETQIIESEEMLNKLESVYFLSGIRISEPSPKPEPHQKKFDLLQDLEKAEQALKDLQKEMRDSHIEDLSVSGFSLEDLLSLNDSEVENELKKVDQELEEINQRMKTLKTKELEFQQLESYVNRNKGAEIKGKSLAEQIKETQTHVEALEEEKKHVKAEISKIKKANLVDTDFDNKLLALNEIIEKRNTKEKTPKVMNDRLVSDIQTVLLKAKMLEQDLHRVV